MAARFNRIPEKGWEYPIIKSDLFSHLPQNTTVMLPSTHDITEHNIGDMLVLISKLLKRNNQLLIVSKPRIKCIELLCNNEIITQYKEKIIFRFTIGSIDNKILQYWEPNAPSFEERIECVEYALEKEFPVTISCEPLLDSIFIPLILKLANYSSYSGFRINEIWIGAMNYIKNSPIIDYQAIYNYCSDLPTIKWKESFRKHLDTNTKEIKIL